MRALRDVIREGAKQLQAAGMEHGRREAEWLLSRLMGSRPLELYLQERMLSEQTAARFFSHIDARLQGVPLQYLLGEAEFCGQRFAVAPGVFIPRPETEAVTEAALTALRLRANTLTRPLRLLDLGTGSGCIAVTLARALPACVVVGVEVSWNALRVAQKNIQRHGLERHVCVVQGRWLEPIRGLFDGIISNPPYVPSAQVDRLPLDVRQEPRISLDGGDDGMQVLVHLMAHAPRLLAPGGILALECGEEQVDELMRAASTSSWIDTARPLHDLAGRPRGVLMTRAQTD